MRRGLQRGNKRIAFAVAPETVEFLGGDDNDLLTAVHGYMLRTLAANLSDQLTEASLGILQEPMTHPRVSDAWFAALTC